MNSKSLKKPKVKKTMVKASSKKQGKKSSFGLILGFFVLIISVSINIFLFLQFIDVTHSYELASQQANSLEENNKKVEDDNEKLTGNLAELQQQYNIIAEGHRLPLQNNEYTVFATKVGDKVGDFVLKEISPWGDENNVISTDSAVIIFEGETVVSGEYEFGDFGGDHYCLGNLTEESRNKIPRAVDMSGNPKRDYVNICFDDPESMKLFKGKEKGKITAKVSGYSNIFCDCDQPNYGGSKIVEILSLT